jgi:hypothetical protein
MTVTSGLGQYLEDALLAWHRGTAFPAPPATLYLALFTTPPVNASDGSAVEVSGNNYSRKSFSADTSHFAAPSGAAPATMATNANLVFATPSGSWGAVTGWGLYDAASGGNLLDYGTFGSVSPGNGDTVEFLSGNLTLSVS